MLIRKECAEVAKPEWWNDEGLKALSAKVMRAAPNDVRANDEGATGMRASVLRGGDGGAWEAGPRTAAELEEAATHYERAAALRDAPAVKAKYAELAVCCRSQAAAM